MGLSIFDTGGLSIFGGKTGLNAGAVGTPSLYFLGDTDTGIYRVGANELGIVAGGYLALGITSDGTKVTLKPATGDYLRIGDAGTTANSLNSEDDLMVTGVLEVKGPSWFENGINANATIRMKNNTALFVSTSTTGHKWRMDARDVDGGAWDEVASIVNDNDPYFALNTADDGRVVALNYGNIAVSNYKIVRVTKSHTSDLFDATATTDNATIWTQPVNSKLIAVMMRLETQFAGTGPWTDLRVTLGLAGDEDGLLTSTGNMVTDSTDTEYETVGAYYTTFKEGIHGKTTSTIDWKAYATCTTFNLDTSSAGSMDFYFLYEEA